ncbi:MAG TPA: hypothetical protein VFS16_11895 [Acidimicrobiia bacterium]|nr:hypothetical protein [Acidimicrobiia bacterium]
MLERGEAIGLLVLLAVMLAATLYVGVRRSTSFAFVFAPVELALAGWVAATGLGPPGDGPGGRPPRFGPPRWPRGQEGGGGPGGVREPRRPRPGSGSGIVSRHR